VTLQERLTALLEEHAPVVRMFKDYSRHVDTADWAEFVRMLDVPGGDRAPVVLFLLYFASFGARAEPSFEPHLREALEVALSRAPDALLGACLELVWGLPDGAAARARGDVLIFALERGLDHALTADQVEATLLARDAVPWRWLHVCPTDRLVRRALDEALAQVGGEPGGLDAWLDEAPELDWRPYVWPLLRDARTSQVVSWRWMNRLCPPREGAAWLELFGAPDADVSRHALARFLSVRRGDAGEAILEAWGREDPRGRERLALAAYTLAWRDGEARTLDELARGHGHEVDVDLDALVDDAALSWVERADAYFAEDPPARPDVLLRERGALDAWADRPGWRPMPCPHLPEHVWITLDALAQDPAQQDIWWDQTRDTVGEETLSAALEAWLLRDPNVGRPRSNVGALFRLGAPLTAAALGNIMRKGALAHGRAAHDALLELGREGTHEFVATLEHHDHWTRAGAARALGLLGDERAVGPLRDALEREVLPGRREVILRALEQCDPAHREAGRVDLRDTSLFDPAPDAITRDGYIERLRGLAHGDPSLEAWVLACELIERARRTAHGQAVIDYALSSPLADWPEDVRALPYHWNTHRDLQRLGPPSKHTWWPVTYVFDLDGPARHIAKQLNVPLEKVIFHERQRDTFARWVRRGWAWCHEHDLPPSALVVWATVMRTPTPGRNTNRVLRLEHGFGVAPDKGLALGDADLGTLGDRGAHAVLPPGHPTRDTYDVSPARASLDLRRVDGGPW
jgi:hypothetical protein